MNIKKCKNWVKNKVGDWGLKGFTTSSGIDKRNSLNADLYQSKIH
jgi:hypothetical protein